MCQFKIESYLYMPVGTPMKKIERILYSRFDSVYIRKIEPRENEVAVDFNVIVDSSSAKTAEIEFKESLKGYDVDNYVVVNN